MHRDVKLGLALGILIIGFAAAFCFPRQHAMPTEVAMAVNPKLEIVDQKIRQLRVRTFVGAELAGPRKATHRQSLKDVLDMGLDETAVVQNERPNVEDWPEPIRPAVAPRETPIAAIAVSAKTTVPTKSAVPESSVAPAADVLTPDEERIYTVQNGDTLCGIASRLMGSSRKFETLFQANRDQLKTANSLKVGMVLKIPGESPALAKAAPSPVPTTPTSNPSLTDPIDISNPAPAEAGPPVQIATSQDDDASAQADANPTRSGRFSPAENVPGLRGPRIIR
jgi:hypothetical protein